jgi:hypothetical protein
MFAGVGGIDQRTLLEVRANTLSQKPFCVRAFGTVYNIDYTIGI